MSLRNTMLNTLVNDGQRGTTASTTQKKNATLNPSRASSLQTMVNDYQRPSTSTKTPPKSVSTGGATLGSVGSSGGKVGSSGGRAGASVSTPSVPKVPTYNDLSADMKKIYDNFLAYDPDFASLDRQQQAIRDLYAQQLSETRQFGESQQSSLQAEMERTRRDTALARGENVGAFRDARMDIENQLSQVMRQQESNLSGRGLGDSGVAQLANVQSQMAAGEATSQVAESFYDYEEQLQRNMQDAEESYRQATVNLTQSVQSAVTQITQAQAMSDGDYQRMIEQIKQQVVDSKNNVESMRANVLQTAFQNAMAQAEFAESQRQFQAQMSMQERQLAASQAQAAAQLAESRRQAQENSALRERELAASTSASDLATYNQKQSAVIEQIRASQAGAAQSLTLNQLDLYAKQNGMQDDPLVKSMLEGLRGAPSSSKTSNSKSNNKIIAGAGTLPSSYDPMFVNLSKK